MKAFGIKGKLIEPGVITSNPGTHVIESVSPPSGPVK
jgi:hypothetical protein